MKLFSTSLVISIGIALLAAVVAQAGPAGPENQGVVKLMDDADGQFFLADVDGSMTWVPGVDAQFRIQGGTLANILFAQADLTGNGQEQLGVADGKKFYFESGNFAWTPGTDSGDVNFFFAPDVGLVMVGSGDWAMAGRDCVMKVGDNGFIFVDKNCNDAWDGSVTDAQFRIQGGTETGIYFVYNNQIGLMTDNKYFIESGNFAWTPGTDSGDINGFFAPNVGTTVAVVTADFDGDTVEDFAKIADDGFIYADLNGNLAWDGQPTDGRFRIQGATLVGPYLAGSFLGNDGAVGQFEPVKVYVDGTAADAPDAAWTPAMGTETVNFFAPNVGDIQAAGAGNYGAPL